MKKILVLIVLFNSFVPMKSSSMPVEDFMNMPHNVMSAMQSFNQVQETIKQYKLLVQEYEMMVKNMAAPYMWVWQQVNDFEKNIEHYKKKYGKYADAAAWEEHFASFIDPNAYAANPCFKFGGCTPAENTAIRARRAEMIKKAGEASMDFVKSFKEFGKEYKLRKDELRKIQKAAQSADGNLKSMGVQLQYLNTANEALLALRSDMMALAEKKNMMDALELDKIATQKAADEKSSIRVVIPYEKSYYAY